ncbi:hypothetical protein [Natronorubrum daqingense]|uniref:Transporter n=1 Tax=Natronorubrum daqingense TaxID=588898 RepID=A0A1N7CRQ9_9EURY|nr:hypothetical protein [Natronorubrum daqingense]SIR66259.1 hypothetical protein SAMN05421809_1849 [Natronorubrum daqingense]
MNQWYLYHLLMGIIGLSVGFVGFSEILSQGISLGTSLMAVGALAILSQTGYALFIRESSELTERQSIEIVAIGAILCSAGALLHILV